MTAPSPTQRPLTRADVARLIGASLGAAARVADCGPLHGGSFATVWWVHLDDGARLVLKVAPPDGVPLLRYEHGVCAAEARYLRLVAAHAPDVPVPPLLHHGSDPTYGEWLVTGLLRGRSLADLAADGAGGDGPDDDGPARYDLGVALAALHRVTGDRFGHDDGRPSGATWRDAFAAMVDAALDDAADWDVSLPVLPDRIRALVRGHAPALDAVRRPALVHFDGWDGNVLAAAGPDGRLRLTGLVDGERFLYADRLMDLVSPLLFKRAEDEPDHPTVRGYRDATDEPFNLDTGARRRLGLYRMYLYLLMVVEMPSRGMTPASHPERHARLVDLLAAELHALAGT
ncbi:phosphotransferase family protein [Micromonospora sp. URMC 103]|uniref:phosphotransferase family protein n=1 Tax=Micromonospora sp. URMC 103 TaxID=3423406 RepID=UPI003F1A9B6E